jgi:hypothetical protein
VGAGISPIHSSRRRQGLASALLAGVLAAIPGAAPGASRPPLVLRPPAARALVLADPGVWAQNKRLVRHPPPGGGIDASEISRGDLTGDGRREMLVPIRGGADAGVVAYAVYGQDDGRAMPLLAVNDVVQARVAIRRTRIVERLPVYRRGDPEARPSLVQTSVYRWDGGGFALQRRTITRR